MDKLFKFIEEKLLPPLSKLAQQKYLRAVREGIISTMPIIMVGSFYILIVMFPIPAWRSLIEPYIGDMMLPFRISVGLMALYAVYGMGSTLAEIYELDPVSGGSLSLATFLMANAPKVAQDMEGADLGFVLPMQYLGGAGIFTGILSMILAVEILRWTTERGMIIKLPEQVPPSVARSFEAIIPGFISVSIVWIITIVFGFDVNAAIQRLFQPLVHIAGNSYLGVVVPTVLITLLWAAGIHGVSIVGSVMRPIWLQLLEENMQAVADGGVAQHIGTEGFTIYLYGLVDQGYFEVCISLALSPEYLKQIGRFPLCQVFPHQRTNYLCTDCSTQSAIPFIGDHS